MAGALVAVVAAVLVIIGAGSTNAACRTCHGTTSAADVPEAHARASCYACHLRDGVWSWPGSKVREIFVMYPKAIAGKRPSSAGDPVSRGACLRCHEQVMRRTSESKGLRISHADCAQGRTCGACHARAAHGEKVRWAGQPVMEECVSCHKQAGAPAACDACHSERSERERLARGPWQVTHGPGWERTHGMGTLEWCSTCHPAGYCARCHGVDLPHPADFGRTHGAFAKRPDAKCLTCHDATTLCDSCHGVEMPHPKGFLASHSKVAASASDPKCLSCHFQKDCTACHTLHIHPGSTNGTARLPRPGEIGLEGGTP
ncbi:hypothetical protein MX659_03725 [Coriobacteriia bacterium Es71-Z0120]|uniref:cytochrome c3 family protein n=1 Tax=Parvivirga hydrogeniphila TaxID=2939460 RepID=UPI002260880E|nr:cytochrome c3 family protein [Parvivirga hydrogeniphila]MCL4078711.1 hypothetical protein [Parvivirga hydrogeniphila]